MSVPTPPTGSSPPDISHEIAHIKSDVGKISDDVQEIKRDVSRRSALWQKWLSGGIAATVLAALLTHYFDLRSNRDELYRKVNTLQQDLETFDQAKSDLRNMKDLLGQYAALETYALQQDKLSQEEVSKFVTGSSGVILAAPQRKVWITYPAERLTIPDGSIVRGIANIADSKGGELVSSTCWEPNCSAGLDSSERTIWILTQSVATNRFYPQGSAPDQAGPVLLNAAGEWVSPAVFMGGTPSGMPVLIHAVLVSHAAEDAFKTYLEEGFRTKKFNGLTRSQMPPDAEILATTQVFRK